MLLSRLARDLAASSVLIQRMREHHLDGGHLGNPVLENFRGRRGRLNGKEVVLFSLADYLGFDQHPEIKRSAHEAIERYGMHLGSSRIYLDTDLYQGLEADVAATVGAESALTFGSTTLAHLGLMSAIASPELVLFLDLCAHRSMAEAVNLARAKGAEVILLPHDDPDYLRSKLKRHRAGRRHAVVLVDGIYSMTGGHHDLPTYQRIARNFDAILYVDDAHGFGVLGDGRGAAHHFGLSWDNLLYAGSLSKALSSVGGFIAGPRDLLWTLKRTAFTMIFGGPIPTPNVCTARKALALLGGIEGRGALTALWHNTRQVERRLTELGYTTRGARSPILVVPFDDQHDLLACSHFAHECGVHFNIATYPAVPRNHGGLRIVVNAVHQPQDIDRLVESLSAFLEKPALVAHG